MSDLPYYLVHFQGLLDEVARRYDDLLSDEERLFLVTFAMLPRVSQALWVRLISRRHTVFERATVQYDEVSDLTAALAPLIHHGWVIEPAELSVDELFALVTKPRLMAARGLRTAGKKDTLRAFFEAAPQPTQPLATWLNDPAAVALRVVHRPVVDRLRFLFFGNARQDTTTFVVAELGHVRYESVPFDHRSRGFETRRDVEVSWQLAQWHEALIDGAAPRALAAQLLSLKGPWSAVTEARVHRFRYHLGRAAERAGDEALAYTLYHSTTDPRAGDRLHQLGRRWKWWPAQAAARSRLRRPPEEPLSLPGPPRVCVERSVAEALTTETTTVHYVENTLFNTVFGLLFWPVLFAPVPGAFFNAFQEGPADVYRPTFAAARAELIEAAWAQLEAPDWIDVMLARWHEKQGIHNRWVSWHAVSEPLLRQALTVIPVAHWRALFTRLLRDLKAHRSGFPDLIAFHNQTQTYRLLEVKGPGDRLQDHQARWMDFFLEVGIPCAVIPVSWPTP